MPSADLDQLRKLLGHRYQLERELGRGGMGAVYLARELKLDRLVALKVLPEAFADDPVLRDRFLRESRTAAAFSHPNIVPVYAVEEQDNVLAFAMGYVEGESLAERVKRSGALTTRDAVRLMHDVAYALAYAHGRGTVHRDIKPDNIMLDRATNRALVMDFGVARRSDVVANAAGLTRVGEVVGTPEYMSPEQATGDAIDGRSDIYSLGLVMWFALTGTTAMGGESAPRILMRQLTEHLPSIATARSDLPPALVEAVDRCLHKEPDQRFADAGALATALDDAELASPEIPLPIRLLARELTWLTVALPFVLVIGVVFFARQSAAQFMNIDGLIPIVVALAALLARLGQAIGEAGRIARLGFNANDMERGLRAVVDEAASEREVSRRDPDRQQDRRNVIITAGVMFVIALVSIAVALTLRVEIAPGRYLNGGLGVALFFNGVASFGVCFMLLLRDPRRMPLAERLFRGFWLRAPGRWMLTRAMSKETRRRAITTSGITGHRVTGPMISHVATRSDNGHTPRKHAASAGGSTDRLDEIETRLQALELWRSAQPTRSETSATSKRSGAHNER